MEKVLRNLCPLDLTQTEINSALFPADFLPSRHGFTRAEFVVSCITETLLVSSGPLLFWPLLRVPLLLAASVHLSSR